MQPRVTHNLYLSWCIEPAGKSLYQANESALSSLHDMKHCTWNAAKRQSQRSRTLTNTADNRSVSTDVTAGTKQPLTGRQQQVSPAQLLTE